ncbi:MAG: hypothetical protein HQL89_13360 [Magnetococcales bacterium]|nr:hypothetical protein [Magnetococcales bacterium]
MKQLRITFCAIACFAWSGHVQANDFPSSSHQFTSPPLEARFEILQSQLAARWTFRLDRYSGRIWQLVITSDGDSTWEEMPVMGLPKGQATALPHFQIFTSGLAARHTFLIDNDTGKTWVLISRKLNNKDGTVHETNSWELFAD